MPSPESRVVIDGSFDDWRGVVPAMAADGWSIRQRSDPHFVYLQIDLPAPTNVLGYEGTMSLDFDSFSIDFSPLADNGRLQEGALVRAGTKRSDTYPLDFVMLPTHRTQRVEMRIARGRQIDGAATPTFTGPSYSAHIELHDQNGKLTRTLPSFTASLSPAAPLTIADAPIDPLARTAGTAFRVLEWNVANEGIQARPDHFRRVIIANDPDVLILNEVGGVIGAQGVRAFLATITSARSNTPWQFTYGGGGGYQRTVIAARGTVSEFPEFRFINFPENEVATWFSGVPTATQDRERNSIRNGVATGGAAVTIGGKRMAVFGVDLQSAGNRMGSWQEARRQAEARIVRDLGSRVIRERGPFDAVLLGGDHNLVGTRDPLTIDIETGMAFNGRLLDAAELLQLDHATAATWDGSSGPFPPGRLDWFTYSSARLEVAGGFVFDAGDLSEHWRTVHGLQADDSKKSSDHRPLVVDLKWK
jgi:exonuclease III